MPCSVQRSTAVASKQMQMAAPRIAFAKGPAFVASAKPVLAQQKRSAIAKVGASLPRKHNSLYILEQAYN